MRRRLAVLLACGLAFPVAGCGGGHPAAASGPGASTGGQPSGQQAAAADPLSRSAYVRRVNAIFAGAANHLKAITTAKSAPEIARSLRSGGKALGRTADQLEALVPPSAARTATRDLAHGFRTYGDELAIAGASLTAGDSMTYLKTLIGAKGPKQVLAAIKELKGLGYAFDLSHARLTAPKPS